MRNVLIVGASGFIGAHFREFFAQQNDLEVLGFDLRENSEVKYLDVRKPLEIEGEFSEKDVIINLAAIHTTPGHPDHEYFETNILGAENVCEFAERVGIRNIIFTSSIAPYGASEDQKTEETLPMPNTPYGISKLVAEHIHKEWVAKGNGRKLIILRPGVVYGKGEGGNFARLASAISKNLFFYPGRKDTIKACIYVKELVYQSWSLFINQSAAVKTYNFAYEPAYSIEEIAETIADITGYKSPKYIIPARLLKMIAWFLRSIGLAGLGIHPDRVKKLMTSTNISGVKLKGVIPKYKYTFNDSILDWFEDCEKKGLY